MKICGPGESLKKVKKCSVDARYNYIELIHTIYTPRSLLRILSFPVISCRVLPFRDRFLPFNNAALTSRLDSSQTSLLPLIELSIHITIAAAPSIPAFSQVVIAAPDIFEQGIP